MYEKELKSMIEASQLAKDKIIEVRNEGFEVITKDDMSPVTKADISANEIIVSYLKERFPTYAFLTEESEDNLLRLTNDYCFIIDPLDGTKEFVSGLDDFVTLIALSYKGEIVCGVVNVVMKHEYYYAIKNQGAYFVDDKGNEKRIHVNDKDDDLTMLTSRYHPSIYEEKIPQIDSRIKRSVIKGSALKALSIASGEAEIHYRLNSGTKEWDIAPTDLIVKEAGGVFIKPNGENFTYNKNDVYNHDGYIIANKMSNILPIEKIKKS